MHTVQLKEYPEFWREFGRVVRTRVKGKPIDEIQHSKFKKELCIGIMKTEYGIDVTYEPTDRFGVVGMDDRNFTKFLLKWR